ncbi:MAG: transposase [Clostridia bacterium]|nr:transposase [Clostridia bacterium]
MKAGIFSQFFDLFNAYLKEKGVVGKEGVIMYARWLKKRGRNYFGYKNHIKIDTESKLILKSLTSSANVHDSHALPHLFDNEEDKGKTVWADSAYPRKLLYPYTRKIRVHKKGCRYQKLTKRQKACNRKKSKIRCRIEHVFGYVHSVMKGYYFQSRGYA